MRRRSSLVSEVADLIRQLIEEQELSTGDRLPTESEFLQQHQVSRSVLREAISRLETLGLIEVRQGHGMFVGGRDTLANCVHFVRSAMAITPHDLRQFGELRGMLEVWAARRAAELATPDQVAELEHLISELDRTDRSYDEAIALDFEFHRKMFEIAGNSLVSNVILVLQEFVVVGMLQTTPEPRDHHVSQDLHRSVVRAVRDGDAEAAEAAMHRHMEVTIERLAAHATGRKVEKAG